MQTTTPVDREDQHQDQTTQSLACSVQLLWDIPGQGSSSSGSGSSSSSGGSSGGSSKLRHVHLVHALFLGRKIVSRKKFTCAYVPDKKNKAVFVPHDAKKAQVVFEGVTVQPGLLLVTSVIKILKSGKQVLSSLVVDLW
jgi:hypothetical protein